MENEEREGLESRTGRQAREGLEARRRESLEEFEGSKESFEELESRSRRINWENLEGRSNRENKEEKELRDTKAYLEIVLSELEEVKQRLNEQPVRRVSDSQERRSTKKHKTNPMKRIAIVEGILLLVLVVSFSVHLVISKNGEVETLGGSLFEGGSNHSGEISPSVRTVKQVANLKEVITPELTNKIAPFKVTVEKLFGYEYLVFTDGSIKVCYRNEFLEEELEERRRILIDNGDKLVEMSWDYDLQGNLETLCPIYGSFFSEGEKQLAFLQYETKEDQIPQSIRFMDATSLWEYPVFYMKQAIKDLFALNYEELHSTTNPDGDMRMKMKIASASYTYAITKDAYVNAVYYEEFLPLFEEEFDLTIGEDGITFATVVTLSEQEYLGELSGKLVLTDGAISLGKISYGAYVTADQENGENGGLIIPRTEKLTERIQLWGNHGEKYLVPISEQIPKRSFEQENLIDEDGKLVYLENGEKKSIHGIDVSKYQGDIDWEKVKESGVEFAIIRLGFRGYNEGTLELDPYFIKNIEGANKAGVAAGVYFFSQAITVEEAYEEAQFVLEQIKEHQITYPVIFDTEHVATYPARANQISRQLRTDITKTFCQEIEQAGYHPMIYANTKWMVMGIDLEQLPMYDLWFAYYGNNLTFPYDFQMYQYTDSGKIPGIKGNVDMNISFIDYAKKKESVRVQAD